MRAKRLPGMPVNCTRDPARRICTQRGDREHIRRSSRGAQNALNLCPAITTCERMKDVSLRRMRVVTFGDASRSAGKPHFQPEAVVPDFVNPESFAAFFFSALRFLVAVWSDHSGCSWVKAFFSKPSTPS
jgi:hypothetical protein